MGSPRYNVSGTLLEGIAIWGERRPGVTKDEILRNAREAVLWEAANGVQFIRTHADTTDPSLVTVEALLELKDEMREIAEIQVVAFPQDGIYTIPGGERNLRRAVEMGCDCVGAIPHNELTREDGVRSVELAFDLAEKYGRLVDIHCDETGTTSPGLSRSWPSAPSPPAWGPERRRAIPRPCTITTMTTP